MERFTNCPAMSWARVLWVTPGSGLAMYPLRIDVNSQSRGKKIALMWSCNCLFCWQPGCLLPFSPSPNGWQQARELCELAAHHSPGIRENSILTSNPGIWSRSYKTGHFKYVLAKQKLCDKVQGWMLILPQSVSTVEKFCSSKAICRHGIGLSWATL